MYRWWIVLCVACGRIGFDPTGTPTVPCDEQWPEPELLDLGDTIYYAPAISGDGLELYVSKGDTGVIAVSRRARRDLPFPPPQELAASLHGLAWEEHPSIRADGLELYFTDRSSGARVDRSIRASTTDAFTERLGGTGFIVGTADVSADGLTVYAQDFRTELRTHVWDPLVQEFGPPIALPAPVNTGEDPEVIYNYTPAIAQDERELYFVSNRDQISEKIWVAKRASKDVPFATAEIVSFIGSFRNPDVSEDGHILVVDRIDTVSNIFISTRCEP